MVVGVSWGVGQAGRGGGLGEVRVAAAVDVARPAHAVAVGDFEALDAETVAYFYVAAAVAFAQRDVAAFGEPLECHEPDAAVFVGQVGPDDVVEEVRFDGIDSERESCEALRPGSVVKGGGVDDEA